MKGSSGGLSACAQAPGQEESLQSESRPVGRYPCGGGRREMVVMQDFG